MRRLAQGLVALCVLGVFGVFGAACSCGLAEGTYNLDYPGAPCDRGYAECSSDGDCWEGFVYEPETRCIDQVCQCPVDGYIICNKKGHPPDNNMRGCYHPSECEPGEVCQPEVSEPPPEEEMPPPPPEPECTPETVSMCPGPPDKRCGVPTCIEGVCGVAIKAGPIASQKMGDCRQSQCTVEGKVIEIEDPSDYYDDGRECTFDVCMDGLVQALDAVPIVCPDTGEGFCFEGACVQCLDHSDCNANELCNPNSWRCEPFTCIDNAVNGGESDEDCGGDCVPCNAGESCLDDSDCKSNVCKNLKCQAPTCDDNKKNDGETDTDCGIACKDSAKLCGDGKGCKLREDCTSGVCWAGKCQAPTCTDGVKNDKETGVDCGGVCEACEVGQGSSNKSESST
jgi:hypothetical protein